jgi:hypothetical protein
VRQAGFRKTWLVARLLNHLLGFLMSPKLFNNKQVIIAFSLSHPGYQKLHAALCASTILALGSLSFKPMWQAFLRFV